jgi:hypothetical protein
MRKMPMAVHAVDEHKTSNSPADWTERLFLSNVICGVKSRRPRCRKPSLRANAAATDRRNNFNWLNPLWPVRTKGRLPG